MSKHSQHHSPFFAATLTNIAREFRREPTAAEKALWQLIRQKQLGGWKFRRQHPIGRYIADFCCPKAHLFIEVDGEIHRQQVEADQEREQDLILQGYRILRFTNRQVFEIQTKWCKKFKNPSHEFAEQGTPPYFWLCKNGEEPEVGTRESY